ncbi:hypothetical protein Tco_0771219 [Tanacetum coccineum]|uniref:Uncharacterized protein n=1 Tax=Tanacetum coccineum TaxID=301880 RepID=A0ABQ4ZIH4_9ASTR
MCSTARKLLDILEAMPQWTHRGHHGQNHHSQKESLTPVSSGPPSKKNATSLSRTVTRGQRQGQTTTRTILSKLVEKPKRSPPMMPSSLQILKSLLRQIMKYGVTHRSHVHPPLIPTKKGKWKVSNRGLKETLKGPRHMPASDRRGLTQSLLGPVKKATFELPEESPDV